MDRRDDDVFEHCAKRDEKCDQDNSNADWHNVFPVSEPFIPHTAWTPEWHDPPVANTAEMRIRAGDAYEPDDAEISDAIIKRLHLGENGLVQ